MVVVQGVVAEYVGLLVSLEKEASEEVAEEEENKIEINK